MTPSPHCLLSGLLVRNKGGVLSHIHDTSLIRVRLVVKDLIVTSRE